MSTHIHHANVDVGTRFTRNGFLHDGAAIRLERSHRKHERLEKTRNIDTRGFRAGDSTGRVSVQGQLLVIAMNHVLRLQVALFVLRSLLQKRTLPRRIRAHRSAASVDGSIHRRTSR